MSCIEQYFSSKANKRKAEDSSPSNEVVTKQLKILLDEQQTKIPVKFQKLCDINWQEITAENLCLSYALLFSHGNANKIFDALEQEVVYNAKSQVQVFGKLHLVPRKQAAYGDYGLKYTFSGVTVSAKEWTPALQEIRDTVCAITGHYFNFVLVNRYKDGQDHMGEHKDNEKDLVRDSPIVSLSFGEPRDFIFRHQDTRGAKASRKLDPVKLVLKHGSILLMKYPTNQYWYHSLPVRKRCLGPRINLTFRHMHK